MDGSGAARDYSESCSITFLKIWDMWHETPIINGLPSTDIVFYLSENDGMIWKATGEVVSIAE